MLLFAFLIKIVRVSALWYSANVVFWSKVQLLEYERYSEKFKNPHPYFSIVLNIISRIVVTHHDLNLVVL